MLAVAACARQAEVALAADQPGPAREATRRAVTNAESLRGAVHNGQARQRIADFLRDHYERAAILAVRLHAPELVLDIAERLRTERITGLLGARTSLRLPPAVDEVLRELDRINEQLARNEGPGGTLRGLPDIADLCDLDTEHLHRRRDTVRARLAELTTSAFTDIYDAPPADVTALYSGLDRDVFAVLPVHDSDGDHLISVWRPHRGPAHARCVPQVLSYGTYALY